MENRIFGEPGSRKRTIWMVIGTVAVLTVAYQLGYSSGVRSTVDIVERLAVVPPDRPAVVPEPKPPVRVNRPIPATLPLVAVPLLAPEMPDLRPVDTTLPRPVSTKHPAGCGCGKH